MCVCVSSCLVTVLIGKYLQSLSVRTSADVLADCREGFLGQSSSKFRKQKATQIVRFLAS